MQQAVKGQAEKFSGALTVRIRELDGLFDHVCHFDDEIHLFELPCHSRIRKGKSQRQELEKLDEFEQENRQKNETPLIWLRCDPHMEWIAKIKLLQPDYMWICQLMDRDVVAQHEATLGLQCYASSHTCHALNHVLNNSKAFHRVRVDACTVMAMSSSKDTNWIGLDLLLKFYKQNFFDRAGLCVRPLQFSDLSLYMLQQSIPSIVANVKNCDEHTPQEALDFLLHLLKYHDNSQNLYSDYSYLSTIIRALGKTRTTGISDDDKILNQVHEFLHMDKLYPSYRNSVSVACIETLCELQACGTLKTNVEQFKQYCRQGNYEEVRMAAFKALVVLSSHEEATLKWLLTVVGDASESPSIRLHLCSCLRSHIAQHSPRFDFLRTTGAKNLAMVDLLWNILNCNPCAYDCRLRTAVFRLYHTIWGIDEPPCLAHRPSSSPVRSLTDEVKSEEERLQRKRALGECAWKTESLGGFKLKLKLHDSGSAPIGTVSSPKAKPPSVSAPTVRFKFGDQTWEKPLEN